MKLGQLRKDRDSFTKTLSEIVRQLDFAGIAIVWIFRTNSANGPGLVYSKVLLWPLGLFVASLACDLMHYGWSSLVVDNRYRRLAKGDVDDETVVPGHSPFLNWPTRIFFWSKAGLAVIAYFLLLSFIAKQL